MLLVVIPTPLWSRLGRAWAWARALQAPTKLNLESPSAVQSCTVVVEQGGRGYAAHTTPELPRGFSSDKF